MSQVMGAIQITLAVFMFALNTAMATVRSYDSDWVIGTGWWASPVVSAIR